MRQALAAVSGDRPGERRSLRPRIRRPAGRTDGAAGPPHGRRRRRSEDRHRLAGLGNHRDQEARRGGETPLRRPRTSSKAAARSSPTAPPAWLGPRRSSAAAWPGWKPARPRLPAASHGSAAAPERCRKGLADGFRRSAPLQSGLRRASVQVVSNDAKLTRQARRLQRTTPGLFDSGYFVLSALDGARPAVRERAGEAIDLERRRPGGGDAGHLPLHLQLARLDRPQQAARGGRRRARPRNRARRPASPAAPPSSTTTAASPAPASRFVIAAITLATFLVLAPRPARAAAGGDRGRPQPGDGRRSPSASSRCSSTCPKTGRWAATATSTRSARRRSSASSSASRSTTRCSCWCGCASTTTATATTRRRSSSACSAPRG